jgi:hypothetical protein
MQGDPRIVGTNKTAANSVLRPIRTILIRTLLCGGLWLAQWLAFPYLVNPKFVRDIIVPVVMFLIVLPVIVRWLWSERHQFIACCCVLLAGISLFSSLAVVFKKPKERMNEFMAAAAQDFVLEETNNGSVLRHPGLKVTVQPPGSNFTATPAKKNFGRCVQWTFVNQAERKVLAISVQYTGIEDAKHLRSALDEELESVRSCVARESHVAMTVERADVVWQGKSRYAEAECDCGNSFCCTRILPVDGGAPGPHPVFVISAFAQDRSAANDMARSLDVTHSPWASTDREVALDGTKGEGSASLPETDK